MRPSERVVTSLIAELASIEAARAYLELKANLALTADDEKICDQYFHQKQRFLIESLTDLCVDDDESEALRLLPHVWLELRFEWTRLNTQMQYQTLLKGQAKPHLMCIGASLSHLLSIIERHLQSDEIYWCTKLAAEPITYLQSRTQLAGRMVDLARGIGTAGKNIIETLAKAQEDVRIRANNPSVDAKMESAIENVETVLMSSMNLGPADLKESFEMVLADCLRSSPIPFVLHRDPESQDIPVPAETIAALNGLFSVFLKSLASSSIENSVTERRAANKTDHVQISWKLKKGASGRILLVIEDDGLGRVSLPQVADLPQDWLIGCENRAGQGTRVHVQFRGTQIVQMIHFEVRAGETTYPFVIPTANVTRTVKAEDVLLRREGARTIATLDETVVPFADLGELMASRRLNDSDQRQKAFFLLQDSTERRCLVAISEIHDQVRGSTRSGPTIASFVDGYVLIDGRAVPVLDADTLMEVVRGERPIQRVA